MTIKFCFAVIFSLSSVSGNIFHHRSHIFAEKRIIDGEVTNIQDHKYFVVLYDGKGLCGGALVKRDKVVTAGHCVVGFQKPVKVYPGVSKLSDVRYSKFYESDEFYVHDLYNDDNKIYDLGVIVLKEPVELTDNITLINIASTYPPVGANITLVGHGLTNCTKIENEHCIGNISNELRKTDMVVVNIIEPMIVVNMTANRPCKGDSGGPYTYDGELVAVESHSQLDYCRGAVNFEASTAAPQMLKFLAKHDIYPVEKKG